MHRRDLLKAGGFGALGLSVGGCATNLETVRPVRGVGPLAPVSVSWDQIIRTSVGLRPYRPSGFVVRADRLDNKTIIHNYGHGGAGHSLSWGTGLLATQIALEHESRDVAVIGSGVVGLTAARQLQRHGFNVTIYAMAVPPHTTSNNAWASFTPTSGLIALNRRTPQWDRQFRQAVRASYLQLQLLAGRDYGVSWIRIFSFLEAEPSSTVRANPDRDVLLPRDVRTSPILFGPGEHPFPSQYARQQSTIRIEPNIYLDALTRDFLLFGGRVVIRTFDTTNDIMTLGQSIVMNCTGLGSRDLFGDDELTPVKGQLTFLPPQQNIDYATFGGIPDSAIGARAFGIHMMPRRDGIALGGTSERGVWDLEPDEDAARQIVQGHMELFNAMK